MGPVGFGGWLPSDWTLRPEQVRGPLLA